MGSNDDAEMKTNKKIKENNSLLRRIFLFGSNTQLCRSAYSFLMYKAIHSDGSVNRRLLSLLDPKVSAPSTTLVSAVSVSSSDHSIDPSRNLWFRCFIPAHTSLTEHPLPFVVYFHGGGFVHFGPDSVAVDNLCRRLSATAPAVVVSVNYRLAPEHRFPCAYDDAFDTLKFVDERNYEILPPNTDFQRCFIAGDSAGGNIAHHVTLRARRDAHEFKKLKIIGLVGLQPFFGGEERTESEFRLIKAPIVNVKCTDNMWKAYLPAGANRNHEAAHVFGGGPESEPEGIDRVGFPRALVIIGGLDPLQDWERRYCDGLKRKGVEVKAVEYPNAIHGFYAFESTESGLLFEELSKFIRSKT